MKKRPDSNTIIASNLDEDFIKILTSELRNLNQIENRRISQGLDCFRRVLSISQEQENILHNHMYQKCINITSKSVESNTKIDNVSAEAIPKIVTGLKKT